VGDLAIHGEGSFADTLVTNAAVITALRPLQRVAAAWHASDDAAKNVTRWQRSIYGAKLALRQGTVISAEMITAAAVSYAVERFRHGERPDEMTAAGWMLHGAAMAVGRFVSGQMTELERRLGQLGLRDERDREFTFPDEHWITTPERRAAKLAERRNWTEDDFFTARDCKLPIPTGFKYGHPIGEPYTREILAHPDDDAPRWEYARWLRTFDHPSARGAAEFIEWQLRIAEGFRVDPRFDPRGMAPFGVFRGCNPGDDMEAAEWGRAPGFVSEPFALHSSLGESLRVLADERVISHWRYLRGFIEHVAIRAARFLEIAEELFALAPIRHLELTYCKGLDHQDGGLWRRLLASPHLARIRSLCLPKRAFGIDNGYTELNRFSDGDIALLAQSPQLGNLIQLDLEDQDRLTSRAFEALAESRNLPRLSVVRHEVYAYGGQIGSRWGLLGDEKRLHCRRPRRDYVPDLERRHGHRVWFHPVDYYGREDPDLEAVVENPAALRPLR
jgi:uncharacterized protein (TIGR02996 family)